MVGKWHVGFSTIGHKPLARGFDSFYGYLTGKINYWTKQSDYDGYLDLYEGNQLVTNEEEISSDKHTTFLLQEKVEEIIKSHAQKQSAAAASSSLNNNNYKPMFLYYALQMIHSSVSAPDAYVQRCTSATAPITATATTSTSTSRKTVAVGGSATGSGSAAAGNGNGGSGGNGNGGNTALATTNTNTNTNSGSSSSSSGDDDGGDDYVYQQNYCATNLMLDEAIANLTCTINQYGFGNTS